MLRYSTVVLQCLRCSAARLGKVSGVELRHMSNKNENIEIVPPVLPPLPSYRVRQYSTKQCKCDAHSPLILYLFDSLYILATMNT